MCFNPYCVVVTAISICILLLAIIVVICRHVGSSISYLSAFRAQQLQRQRPQLQRASAAVSRSGMGLGRKFSGVSRTLSAGHIAHAHVAHLTRAKTRVLHIFYVYFAHFASYVHTCTGRDSRPNASTTSTAVAPHVSPSAARDAKPIVKEINAKLKPRRSRRVHVRQHRQHRPVQLRGQRNLLHLRTVSSSSSSSFSSSWMRV